MVWFQLSPLVEPTEMERRLNLPPEAFERELAAWLKERPLLNDAGPGNLVIQWLRETWEGGDYQDGPPQRWLPESLVRGLVALLATPFLLLTMLAVVCWLMASGKLPAQRRIVVA
jgi:hypothetical protein